MLFYGFDGFSMSVFARGGVFSFLGVQVGSSLTGSATLSNASGYSVKTSASRLTSVVYRT